MKRKEILKDERFTDTRMGTNSTYEFSNGNTLPLTGSPHAMNYFAVQTDFDGGAWWFHPFHDRFEGFRLTHQPSPWMGDFSYLTILPFNESRNVIYDGDLAKFTPAFCQIPYVDGSKARVTADTYSGIISFKCDGNVKFNIKAPKLKLTEEEGFITGRVKNMADSEDKDFTMYFVISLDCEYALQKKDKSYNIITECDKAELYISTSFISLDQAKINHSRMDKDFKTMVDKTSEKWALVFDKVDIKIDEINPYNENSIRYDKFSQRLFFYHCLYRAYLFPMTYFEIDENDTEIHYDTISKEIKSGKLFTNIGYWDGQKTLFPLLSLIDRDFCEELMEGMVNFYLDTGYLPKWQSPDERSMMPGTLVDNVIADFLAKGIDQQYGETLLHAMIKSANPTEGSKYGRFGAKIMDELGYIPSEYHESVNQTLDNSLSDFSIGKVAEILGRHEMADEYYQKSLAYKNLFDPDTKWFRAKDLNGEYSTDFDPYDWGSPYTEGSAFQNSYNAYHYIEGIIELFGGVSAFEERLDEIANSPSDFNEGAYGYTIHEMREVKAANFGQIGISNQPSFHLPYLYNYVGRPDKAQLLVKELLLNYFDYSFLYDSYPGDEDNGSLSSWFILSSLGFYQVCPGKGYFDLGIPFFDEIRIKLDTGNELKIITKENYSHKKFVNEMLIDGEVYKKNVISYEDLIGAKEITYTLGLVAAKKEDQCTDQ